MKRQPTINFALLLLTAFVLTACGFHMRGSTDHDKLPFKSVFVVISDASPLGVELKRNLAAGANTTVVSDPKEAQAILEILTERKEKSILSMNIQGRVRELTVTYTVRFRLRDNKGKELLAPTTLSLHRTLTYSETHALASESEEALLYRDMQTDAVQQMMRRLAAIKLPV